MKKYKLGITMGDPAGIGPEVIVKTFAQWAAPATVDIIIYGDKQRLQLAATICKVPFSKLPKIKDFHNVPKNLSWGKLTKTAGKAAGAYIDHAIDEALAGNIDGIVTAPINKTSFQQAGYKWQGHTDMLEDRAGVNHTVMMLASNKMRVPLLTHHIPLKDVPKSITAKRLQQTLQIIDHDFQSCFGMPNAAIAVCGLNPHAGEAGQIGTEELRIIQPALQRLRRLGLNVHGPFSPDTIFRRHLQGEFAAVLALYHDQGLIPLKLQAFGKAVNVTLGLPFIRSSVDHGTAFDIAGQGRADAGSMLFAIKYAIKMLQKK